jgi:hypothetical protein
MKFRGKSRLSEYNKPSSEPCAVEYRRRHTGGSVRNTVKHLLLLCGKLLAGAMRVLK